VPIPASATPGPATYRIITSYVCNAIHNLWPIVVTPPDVHFEIKPTP
jgi:hypothetical protein